MPDFKPDRFELRATDARVNMHRSSAQLDATKEAAARPGIPYQRHIRDAIARALLADLAGSGH